MSIRIDIAAVAPGALAAMAKLERYVHDSGLEPTLVKLVKVRASQLNGCAYCVDMHTKEARAGGETEQRLYAVPVWRETPFFTARERAALGWTDAVTEVGRTGVPDAAYEEAREHFSDAEIVDLTMSIVVINGWNRLAISFRKEPGSYQPPRVLHTASA